jgi:stage IV sporulation protein FB
MKSKAVFSVSGGAVLLLAALWFFTDTGTLTMLLVAVIFHEAGHLAALQFFGCRIAGFRADASGALITSTGELSEAEEIICAAAGPLIGAIYAFATSVLGNILRSELLLRGAGISLALSLFNLLPVLPLDGGRILATAFNRSRAFLAFSFIFALSVICAGIVLMAKGMGAGLIIAGIWLMLEQADL